MFVENGIPILRCTDCGHVYSSYNQDEHYAGYWEGESQEYDLDWWDKAHRPIYKDFISRFLQKDQGVLLDVGAGLGFFVKSVREAKPNWNPIGYEISTKAVQFARETNNLDSVHSGLVQDSGLKPNSVDIITLWDVIEHIPLPHSLLQYLHTLLKPGGMIFLQTPNFNFQLAKAKVKVALKGMQPDGHYLEAKDHVQNYTRDSLSRLGIQCGFVEPKFYVLKPIMSVAGSNSKWGVWAKMGYYWITKCIHALSFGAWNGNNTLFVTFLKKN